MESVSNHRRQLSSTLHSQVLEAQIFSSELLQAYLVKVMIVLWFFTHTSLQVFMNLCWTKEIDKKRKIEGDRAQKEEEASDRYNNTEVH